MSAEGAGDHQEGELRVQLGPGVGEVEELVLGLVSLEGEGVVDQEHGGRAVLEGVGRLVPEGGEVGVPLAGEGALLLVLLRLAADDQHGLALDVEPGVVVVVELPGVVLGGDAIAGEDDRHAVERAAAADRQRREVDLGLGLRASRIRARSDSGPARARDVGLPLSVNG